MSEEKPELREENGCILVDVVVNLNYGFGTKRGNYDFIKDCQRYDRGVWLKREEKDERLDCKSIFESFLACTPKGGKLQIIVEGLDDAARTQALRLYSALSSEDTYYMQFDRYAKIEKNKN